jgi:hypothetical protein
MSNDEIRKACMVICNNYRAGTLLLEDYNKYVSGTEAAELLSMLITLRHRSVDCWIHLQSAGPISTKLWQNVKFIRFHKINDDLKRFKDRIPCYEIMKIVQHAVDYQYTTKGNERYFCYVSVLEERIVGMDEETFKQACMAYLGANRSVLTALKNTIDFEQGGKKYKTDLDAANAFIATARHKYFR